MSQTKTVLSAIAEFLLGKKYYAVIINARGTDRCEICSPIYLSQEAAERHKTTVNATASFQCMEIVSFRSRNDYAPTVKRYNTPAK